MKIFSYFLLAFLSVTGFAKSPSAIIKNEIIQPKDKDHYVEVRHIVLKGSNEKIGQALGEIAQKEYSTKLIKYAEPIYAISRHAYMQKNYPILLQRMKGIATAYKIPSQSTEYDTSSLYLNTSGTKCSAVYFPAKDSVNGNNFYAMNRDYYKASRSEMEGKKSLPGEKDMLAQMYVMQIYPDKGYSSIAIGSFDLVSGGVDLMNSKGLAIASLEDDSFGADNIQKDLSRAAGVHIFQLTRLIIETCATLEEAKKVILTNRMAMFLLPVHFIVMDSDGHSFIYERSAKDGSDRFIDNHGNPQVITNHSVADYPTVDKLPAPKKDDPYDSFDRYRRLSNYVTSHDGEFSYKDGLEAMTLAYGNTDSATEGGFHQLPLRTLFTGIVDLNKKTVSVRFYEKDGKINPETKLPELVFSHPFEFSVN